MKTLGVIGGLGPESTIDYYRLLIASYQKHTGTENLPSILINSLDVYYGLRLLEENQFAALADYLASGIQKLADAGADFAIISANTPHLVFDEVQSRLPLPLISIVEAARDAAKAMGTRRAGLLGTRFTMLARFYPDIFARAGMEVVIPNEDEVVYIHDKYIHELLNGRFLPETRARLLEIIERMRQQDEAEAIILAGTELPLILGQDAGCSIPLLDTTRIHVEAAVARLLS